MSLSKNSISSRNISISPIKVKYQTTYTSSWSGYAQGITFPSSSINVNWARRDNPSRNDITGSQSRLYALVKHLYYEQYLSGSLLNISGSWDCNQQSTAASGSSEYEYRYIPTSSDQPILVMYVPPTIYGEQISRNTFIIKPIIGSEYTIIDDGNGNLIDTQNSNVHVGNIIYSQGVIIITNTNYAVGLIVPPSPPAPYYTPTADTVPYTDSYTQTSPISVYVEFTP